MGSEIENIASATSNEDKFVLMLFISGMSVKSISAIENLREICDTYLAGNFELEIIDISQQLDLAAKHQIIATPTLIKTKPSPQKTILGDLSNKNKVLNALDIIAK